MRDLIWRLPLALSLVLQGYRSQNRVLAGLTITAVAISVALAASLEIASRSVDAELLRTASAMMGEADVEISSGQGDLPEAFLTLIGAVDGVAAVAPFTYALFRIADGEREGDPLHVLGVDFAGEHKVHSYSVERDRVEIRDPIRLLGAVNSIVITASLMERLGLDHGDRFEVHSPAGRLELSVQGVLTGEGVASAFAGLVAAMDVYSLQTLMKKEGWLDRIDVVFEPGVDSDAVSRDIEAVIEGVGTLRRPKERSASFQGTIGTLRLAVTLMVAIGIGLACVLGYAAISRTVERRTPEFALMRAAGVEARTVGAIVAIDAALLSGLAGLLGFAAAIPLGDLLVQGFSSASAADGSGELRSAAAGGRTIAVSLGVAALATVFGAAGPARRATATRPLDLLAATRPSSAPTKSARSSGIVWLLIIGWMVASVAPVPVPAVVKVAACLLGIAVLVARLTRVFVRPGLERLRPLVERTFPAIGTLVGESLIARPVQTSVAVTILAVLVSALGGIAIALSSLSDTLSEWVVDRYRDGILLAVGDPYGVSSGDTFLSAETIEIVKQLDGIVAVAERYAVPMFFRDAHIAVVALDAAVVRVHGRLPVVRGSAPALATALGEGHVAVTEAFARSFALGTGDRVSLDSPAGVRTFQIAGVVRGYGSASGSVWMDIATFDAHWTRPGATSLGVWVEGDRDAAASRILEGTADREPIYLRYGEGLERMLRSSVSRFTRLLWLVAIVVGVFGAIGVLNVLVGATLERQRELSLVHAAGFSISQIGRLVVVDSLLAAGIGSAFGIAGAILLGTLMVETLGESMGWFVDFSSRPQQLVVLAVGVHVVAVLAAIYPLWLARRAVLAGVVSVE